MLTEIKDKGYHYFVDEKGRKQGEFKAWYQGPRRQLAKHCFYVNGNKHGEYESWYYHGGVCVHYFYVNGVYTAFDKIPYPSTDEERMLFKLKYDLPLIGNTIASCAIIADS